MSVNKELKVKLKNYLGRAKFMFIAHQVGKLIDSYDRSKKRKISNK